MKRTREPIQRFEMQRTTHPITKKKASHRNSPHGLFENNMYERAFKLMLLGLTLKDLAIAFGVDVTTIENWQRKDENFKRAIRLGKEDADSNVAAALYKRAIGYEEWDTHIGLFQGEAIMTPYKKKIIPDVTAQMYWLTRRQRDTWADITKVEFNGTMHNELTSVNFHALLPQEQEVLQKMLGVEKPQTFNLPMTANNG